MKLYYHPLSTYSHKVLIALYEKGIEFEPEIVQLMDPESRDRYREIYPIGKVPLLVDDNDYMVPESSIIIEFIDSMAEPTLISGDADQTRKIRFKDRMYDLYLTESAGTLFFQSIKPEEQRDQDRIDEARRRIEVTYSFMEMDFGGQPFSNGAEFSMSDCAAAAGLFYAEKFVPFEDKPNLTDYWNRLKSIPSVQRVHAEAAPHLEAMMKQAAA